MNEYNERLLKNVLQDYREENDARLSEEIEEAKNDPLFQNKAGEAEEFSKKYLKKSKRKKEKLFLKVASILLVILIGVSFIPVTVKGGRSTVSRVVVNLMNSEFLDFGGNEYERQLLTYEGKYIPSFIPSGYELDAIKNSKSGDSLVYIDNENHALIFEEFSINARASFDYSENAVIQQIEVLGHDGIMYVEDGVQYVIIAMDDVNISIVCSDTDVDILSFAEKIQKR